MNRYTFIILSFLAATLYGCADDFINEEEEEKIVVEGWIKQGDYPLVMLTTSLPVSTDEKPVDGLKDRVANWAVVTVSDGEKSVTLTGMYDKRYMPPYIYTTADMKGEVGKTYTLTVRYKNMYATATTTIPEPVPLKEIRQEKVYGSDSLYCLSAVFNDMPGRQFYSLFAKKGTETPQFVKCDMGTFDDSILGEGETEIVHPVYQPRLVTDTKKEHSEYYKLGDAVCVELCTLDEQSYGIWYDYQNTASLSGNFFSPYTSNIRSNISGGYGYWCGYGASSMWVRVGDSNITKSDVYASL